MLAISRIVKSLSVGLRVGAFAFNSAYRRGENAEEITGQVDELTGLHSKKRLRMRLWETIGCAIILLDVDNFKYFNDSYGHLAGDSLLKQISFVMRSVIGDKDSIYRLSHAGDEVLVLVKNPEDALSLAGRIQDSVRNSCGCSVSQGICLQTNSFEESFKQADDALYRAKKLGKNRICVAEDIKVEMQNKIHERGETHGI